MRTPPLTVRHRGGSLHGVVYESTDDQVPQHIATAGWETYSAVERYYMDGLLVEITYELDTP